MNYTMEKRNDIVIDLDENLIQSGDFLGIIRLDGLDPLLAWGKLGHFGCSVNALRFCKLTVAGRYGVAYRPHSSCTSHRWGFVCMRVSSEFSILAQEWHSAVSIRG